MSSPSSPSILSSLSPELGPIGNENEPSQAPALFGKMSQGQEVKPLNSSISPEVKKQIVTSDQPNFVNPNVSTLNLEAISISLVEELTIPVALQTLFPSSSETDQIVNSDTIAQNSQRSCQTKKHIHRRNRNKKTGSKTTSKKTSHTQEIAKQQDIFILESSSFPPSLMTEASFSNAYSKNVPLPQRSMSLPLQQATPQAHIQKQQTKTPGSVSDRSSASDEIKPLYHLTRPIEGTTKPPLPTLTNFLSQLDVKKLRKLETRFKHWQRHQLASTIQLVPKENVDTVTNAPIKSIQIPNTSSEISIEENASLTLEQIPTVLEKLIKSRKQVLWDLLIQNLIKLPGGLERFLQILCTKIQAPSSRLEELALAEILTEILLKLKDDELLKHKDVLKKAKFLHVELYILIHTQVERASYIQEDFNATQFIDMILTKEEPSLIYGHHWMTSSHFLAIGLHNRLRSCEDPKQLDLLVEATKLLLDMRTTSPLSVTIMNQFKVLADEKLAKKGPNQSIFQKLERYYWFAIRPLLAISRSSQTVNSKQVVNTKSATHQKNWSEIEGKIANQKLDPDTVERLAQDLTILEADYFNKINPQEFVIWAKQPEKALAIQASISHFNLLSLFVQSQILTSADPKVRARYCKFFIRLGQRLVEKGNVNSAYSILAALNAAAISRLKQTWLKIKAKHSEEKEKLDKLFSPLKNFENYHAHIQTFLKSNASSSETYLIPAVSLLLREFRFIADQQTILTAKSTNDPSEVGCLNFCKFSALSKVCRQFAQYLQSTCHFSSQSSLDKMYFDIASKLEETKNSQNEDALWILSTQHETLEPIKAKESPEIPETQEPKKLESLESIKAQDSLEAQKNGQNSFEKRRKRLSQTLTGSFRITSKDTFKQTE